MIETKIEKDKYSLESIELEKKEIEEQIGLVSKEIKGVESFLENNDTTKRINEINSSILLLEKDKNIREHNYKNYENYINIL
ncbi:hypothetical protein HOG21_05270 [bacterium]|nr:hypothetical protein [bacterium]